MGRHAATPAPGPRDPSPEPSGRPPSPLRWSDRFLLALVTAVVVGAVAGWAADSWTTAGIVALGAAAVTLLATWVASTLPPR